MGLRCLYATHGLPDEMDPADFPEAFEVVPTTDADPYLTLNDDGTVTDTSRGDDDPDILTRCECDNTHQQNDTVCLWCWAYGRRRHDDPTVLRGNILLP